MATMARPRGTPTRALLGAYFTEGSRRLWGILRDHYEGDVIAAAEACGVKPRRMESHLYGDRGPALSTLIAYQKVFGIPVELFTSQPTRPFRAPAMVELLELLRVTLATSPKGRRLPALRTVLRDRCAICKVEPDVVIAYAKKDNIAKRVSGVWMLVDPRATSTAGAA